MALTDSPQLYKWHLKSCKNRTGKVFLSYIKLLLQPKKPDLFTFYNFPHVGGVHHIMQNVKSTSSLALQTLPPTLSLSLCR